MSWPEMAGPTTVPSWNRIWMRAIAATSCPAGTSPGMTALRAGLTKPVSPPADRADQVDGQQRGLGHRGVHGQADAGQAEQGRGHEHERPAVHSVAHRPADQRAQDQGHQLGQAHRADLERRVRLAVDLIGDGHHGELAAQGGDQLAGEQQPEVSALAEGRHVHQDSSGHPGQPRKPGRAESRRGALLLGVSPSGRSRRRRRSPRGRSSKAPASPEAATGRRCHRRRRSPSRRRTRRAHPS